MIPTNFVHFNVDTYGFDFVWYFVTGCFHTINSCIYYRWHTAIAIAIIWQWLFNNDDNSQQHCQHHHLLNSYITCLLLKMRLHIFFFKYLTFKMCDKFPNTVSQQATAIYNEYSLFSFSHFSFARNTQLVAL